MNWTHILWDPTPGGNVEHVEAHDLTTDDVDFVLENYELTAVSQSSGRPRVFGCTPEGRYIIVVYDEVNETTVIPATAYEVPEPGR
jgi:hypothetical protein